MKAIRFDGTLNYVQDAPLPKREGETLVRVLLAGICNTDLEIVKGYAGFRGIPGHEFVGRVEESEDRALTGRRVVGEINAGCNRCDLCRAGDSRHCPERTVLGIHGRDGAFAEFLSLPARNLIEVPDSISDEEAVFVEPLAAACRILEQVSIDTSSRVAVIGDGKLAQLIVRALAGTGCRLTLIGKHEEKLELAKRAGAHAAMVGMKFEDKFDTVIESSGSASGLDFALDMVRPRGTVVLKSTHHKATPLDTSRAVVNEITIVGSRCGRFQPAINLLAGRNVDVRPLISDCMSIEDGLEAFSKAAAPNSLKVLLRVNDS
ncbi:MAG: alcohol dehydrogenase catalytic domain-containing protein [Blastocatellia bacterium]|nr:alcohol dehydrogenase catalytic domain-containing protein [Blastocatellia bacterium]